MVDLFALWLIMLSLLLGPVGPKGVVLDIVDPSNGTVTTVTGRATADGFTCEAEQDGKRQIVLVARRAAGEHVYDLELEGSVAGQVDLAAAIGQLQEGGETTRAFEAEDKRVTVTDRGALRYVIVRAGGEEGARSLLCVRRPTP